MEQLSGKVVIITGAASRAGSATARLFAKEGARLVLTDLWPERLNSIVREIRREGGIITALVHDISRKEQWEQVAAHTINMFGRMDILINSTGISRLHTSLEPFPVTEWAKVIADNLDGTFQGINICLPYLQENNGAIINVSAVALTVRMNGGLAYTTSKCATHMFTKTLEAAWGKYKIRANSVHPGVVLAAARSQQGRYGSYPYSYIPRLGSPEDIAGGILYLASEDSAFISGTEMVISRNTPV